MAMLRRRTAVLGLVVALVAGCGPTVVIPPGLHPRLTVADVSAIVVVEIHSMETVAGRVLRPPRIVRITAIRGGPAAPGFDPVTWIVEAEGTFVTQRGRSTGPVVAAAPTGHFEISDADGSLVAFGFP